MYTQMTKKEDPAMNINDKSPFPPPPTASSVQQPMAATLTTMAKNNEDGNPLIFLFVFQKTYKIKIFIDANLSEYARLIGINPQSEKHLMWIAEEGFSQPLDNEWKTV